MAETGTKKKILLEFEKPLAEIYDKIAELETLAREQNLNLDKEISEMKERAAVTERKTFQSLSPSQIVQVARHQLRPSTLDYIRLIFTDFVELKGDRLFGDDPAIVGGLAFLAQQPVAIIGHQKGHDTRENIYRNFGMPQPEGYRKALRIMRTAEKFGFPLITLIDTPGAFPGLGAEERGQAEAIAHNLLEMSQLQTPILSIVTGEGGSGGALGIAVANKVLMLAYAVYSVISPEACGSILWRNAAQAETAASALKITAPDLLKLKIIDGIIPEPQGGAHNNHEAAAQNLRQEIEKFLAEYKTKATAEITAERYDKFRQMGFFKTAVDNIY
ncbi:acetyl-CoA carboxyltransferase subunit alpha [Candidatus Termititenax persephonae]|uniref:Acetyl-coenzyme A carboxylase carboxyl transferase subunit alpha n=1 Tax=Candidatus Termititenax persephonae TaxID=2218525 RepID=A0A388TI14_9BACT|nr:acetyl-CoA carboxyltransferase subunit alpha [Candidatus Termititenax persephonae]